MFAIFCPLSAHAGNEDGQEVGDVVFRTLHWAAPNNKHSAIYCEYNTDGDPENDANHHVIENEGPDYEDGVRSITFHQFKHQFLLARYYGSKGYSHLDKEKRDFIRRTAVNFVGKIKYTTSYKKRCVDWRDGYKGCLKDGHLQFDEIIGLRSDAFVEYVYALNGKLISGDIINYPEGYNWLIDTPMGPITAFIPEEQYNNMPDATVEDPTKVKNFKTAKHDNAIGKWNDPQSKNPTIEITWQDATDEHSGLWGYFAKWDERSDTIPQWFMHMEDQSGIPAHLRTRVIKADKETCISPRSGRDSQAIRGHIT